MARSVLIVDDNHLIREMLRVWLEQYAEWCVCGEAENGQVAVKKVGELHPDLVILDMQMPIMNGLEAARQIQRLAPKTTVIMFTIQSSDQLVKEAQAVGVKDVVSKCELLGEHLLTALRESSN
jgi:two-component system, NarL family, nitrate/nitrite response regulator NarL